MLLSYMKEERGVQRHGIEVCYRVEENKEKGGLKGEQWRSYALRAPHARSPQMQAEVSPQGSIAPAMG